MSILDIDDPRSWHGDFHELVCNDKIWAQINAILDTDETQAVDFYSQLTCSPEYLRNPLAVLLRRTALDILVDRYEYVMACHGCLIEDKSSYKERGIEVSSPPLLLERARRLFIGIPGFDAAVEDLGNRYYEHNKGKVGLLMSCEWAVYSCNNYCMGSELVSGLANRLGDEARRRHETSGRPSFIKCKIPVAWLDVHTTFPMRRAYANELLALLIRFQHPPDVDMHGPRGGFLLTRSVPPEYIIGFVDMTERLRTRSNNGLLSTRLSRASEA